MGLEEFAVFGDARGDSFSPEAEAGRLEFAAHELDHLGFGESGFFPDFVEAGPVMPSHADDTIGCVGA